MDPLCDLADRTVDHLLLAASRAGLARGKTAPGGPLVEGAARGFVLTTGQMILKEIAVAAPVISSEGRPVAAVQCAVSAYDWTPERVEREIVPILLDTANSITPSAV